MMYEFHCIAMFNNEKSMAAAKKCLESGKKFGYYPKLFKAITPEDNPQQILKDEGIPVDNFKADLKYSRLEPAIGCFLSHYFLWKMSVEKSKPIIILEHDSIINEQISSDIIFSDVINLGKPSYGKYRSPSLSGVYDLFSKPNGHFPGTHGYFITPIGAQRLIAQSKIQAGTPDLFLSKNTMPWLKEYYPWPISAEDTFTTIQKETGCIAKHNYNETFEIL